MNFKFLVSGHYRAGVFKKWWPLPDSNRGPDDYEARRESKIYHLSRRKLTLFSGA